MTEPKTKAGYVAIVGKPNAGKSTLMNALVGAKLSIVTPKPQTTRKRVLGIFSNEALQVVFIDNPGVLHPRYELQKQMMNYVSESLSESDIILVIIDVSDFRGIDKYFPDKFYETLKSIDKPKFLVINKIDLLKEAKQVLPLIKEFSKMNLFNEIIPISALKDAQTEAMIKLFEKYIPESEFFYDPELLSVQNERFFVSELIRECIFTEYRQEIPYSTEVNVVEFKEREFGKWYISAEIVIERSSQKIIVIGEKGEKIKHIGTIARAKIEEHLQKEVYLELFVKIRERWRNNKTLLKSYGY